MTAGSIPRIDEFSEKEVSEILKAVEDGSEEHLDLLFPGVIDDVSHLTTLDEPFLSKEDSFPIKYFTDHESLQNLDSCFAETYKTTPKRYTFSVMHSDPAEAGPFPPPWKSFEIPDRNSLGLKYKTVTREELVQWLEKLHPLWSLERVEVFKQAAAGVVPGVVAEESSEKRVSVILVRPFLFITQAAAMRFRQELADFARQSHIRPAEVVMYRHGAVVTVRPPDDASMFLDANLELAFQADALYLKCYAPASFTPEMESFIGQKMQPHLDSITDEQLANLDIEKYERELRDDEKKEMEKIRKEADAYYEKLVRTAKKAAVGAGGAAGMIGGLEGDAEEPSDVSQLNDMDLGFGPGVFGANAVFSENPEDQ
eukprot:ANDGO_05560.mRNA.1 hypothetical protein